MSPFIEVCGRYLSSADRRVRSERKLKAGDGTTIGNLTLVVLSDDALLARRYSLASPVWSGDFDQVNGFVKDKDNIFSIRQASSYQIRRKSIYVEGQEK